MLVRWMADVVRAHVPMAYHWLQWSPTRTLRRVCVQLSAGVVACQDATRSLIVDDGSHTGDVQLPTLVRRSRVRAVRSPTCVTRTPLSNWPERKSADVCQAWNETGTDGAASAHVGARASEASEASRGTVSQRRMITL